MSTRDEEADYLYAVQARQYWEAHSIQHEAEDKDCPVRLPVVGSSKYSTLGLPNKATARLSLLRIPPLYAPARVPPAATSLTCGWVTTSLKVSELAPRACEIRFKGRNMVSCFAVISDGKTRLPCCTLPDCMLHRLLGLPNSRATMYACEIRQDRTLALMLL